MSGREPRSPTMAAAGRRAARRRHRRRRAAVRRRRVALLAVAAGLTLLIVLLSPGTHAPARRTTLPPISTASHTSIAKTPARTSRPPVHHAVVPNPGSLPQTTALPSAATPTFRGLMAALWAGVVHDSTAQALPAFFPEGAYAQLKAITDPGADWSLRLVHDYGLDIGAAHRLLGSGAAGARLIDARVTASYAHWIEPGVCDNRIGYFELPNARVVYREGGQIRSFGIASMISWRGVWYVVHFGAILRASDVGTVDAAAIGPGVSAYSGTC
jgi:hypothetical protein